MDKTLSGRAAKAMKSMAYPKFAATMDSDNVPNVVPLLSARMIDPDTMAFVRFMVYKTARNFESNKKITFACQGPGARAYVAKGEFQEWVTQGPLLEQFESEPLYRYNAYMGANYVGVVKVRELEDYQAQGLLAHLVGGLARRAARTKEQAKESANGPMPAQVLDKWERTAAIKFLGLVDEQGDPVAVPIQGVSAPDPSTLVFRMPGEKNHPLNRIEKGRILAASVLAFEPVAYQVKGTFQGAQKKNGKRTGSIKVTQVFSAAPPVPGRRIYPPEAPLG